MTATARQAPANLIAPDTSGMNFYRADPSLADLLRIHLPEKLFQHIEPHLDRLGALAGGTLDECARRDPKGLYAKAKSGKISNFTGIDAPYERPDAPEVHLKTLNQEPASLADAVLSYLAARGLRQR